MSGPVLEYSVDEGIATLLLNRPDKRNALSGELIDALKAALGQAETDASVRVVLIRGAGQDFCSGADLGELERSAEMGHEESVREATRLGELFVHMRRHARPIVAAVHGRALAGGAGLATACDLVLASEDAEIGYSEVLLGFVPAMVMTILRRKVPEALAFELITRGDRISAGRAAEIGLVNRVFPAEWFDGAVREYVTELASRPPAAVALSKDLLYSIDGVGFEDGIAMGAEVNAVARQTEECREGVRRFLERTK
ncbi:MAG: enoyl-CoA hydratase/isomerase family protein [Longimicrobiales bacterium]